MATNKVFKVIRAATKKTIGNATSDYADITLAKSGDNITVTATFAASKTGKVLFYCAVPSIADSDTPPADLSSWDLLGSVSISGATSVNFVHSLTGIEFAALSYCARLVNQDNSATNNGTADFSS